MPGNSVLIIDDEDKLRSLLGRIIALEGYVVSEAANAKAGLKKLEQEEFAVVLCDVKLPDSNGIELTQKIKALYPSTEVIILTAYGTIADGVQAIKAGAFDYITKGDDNDKIIPLLNRALDKAQMQQRLWRLEKKMADKYGFDKILGHSKQIHQAIELAKKVAATNSTVLLTGETGTGKEVFAQAIHYSGERKNKNFVAVNCAALGKDILESELFGYRAGAFTGATKDKKGLFEEANNGTIFLDEIGELSIDLQAKLLRVLETKEFIKVGDTKTTQVDVRVIAATNRDLYKESEGGHFRIDLFYRLAVFQIILPPLRERVRDIETLATYFIKISADRMNKPAPAMTDAFIKKLEGYPWKGNIRELKNAIERIIILTDNDTLDINDIPFEMQHAGDGMDGDARFDLAVVEKQHIYKVLAYTNGNKTEAARLLNIGVTTLYRKLDEYKIV